MGKVCGDRYVAWVSNDVEAQVISQIFEVGQFGVSVGNEFNIPARDISSQIAIELILIIDSIEFESELSARSREYSIQPHRRTLMVSVEREEWFALHCSGFAIEQ